MTNERLRLQIPVGVRDILPEEAMRKRTLENIFARTFRAWGYQEVMTPSFEYYEAMSVGRGAEEDVQLYKFIDRQGHVLTLRPDMTTPIARLVSTRMKDSPLPLRLFYIANVFSFEDPQAGRQREFSQAGIELIGDGSPFADAEAISIAVEIIKASGLRNFKISIGHVDILYGLMEELGLPEDREGSIKAAVSNKNYVGLQELLDEFNVSPRDKERFMQVITTHGGRETVAEAAKLAGNRRTLDALEALSSVYEALQAYDVTAKVELDLGVLRGLDYYTGVVFEGYSAYLGFPILGGGRYDNLLGQFGFDCPATGFALGMERLLLSLEREGSLMNFDAAPDYLLLYKAHQAPLAFRKARELRDAGHTVLTRLIDGSGEEAGIKPRKEVITL